PLSRIEESTIKTFNNQKTMNTIKCLCEANIGDSVYSNGNMYSVLEKDATNHTYKLQNVVTDETLDISSQEEAQKYELTDDVLKSDDKSDETKNSIKTCSVCADQKKKLAEMQNSMKSTETDTVIDDATTKIDDTQSQSTQNDVSILMEELVKTNEAITSLTSRIEILEASMQSIKSVGNQTSTTGDTTKTLPEDEAQTDESTSSPDETQDKEDDIVILDSDSIKTFQTKSQSINQFNLIQV
ncbi:MAG: hypothetical protein ACRCZ2_05400, partial [Fusobacteriaceae bacterium]